MKKADLKRIIKEEVQKVLKEYTDNNFSGRELLASVAKEKPDMFGQQAFDEFFPMGSKSEAAAIRALKNYDTISQRSPIMSLKMKLAKNIELINHNIIIQIIKMQEIQE